jgi:hypothetical protein
MHRLSWLHHILAVKVCLHCCSCSLMKTLHFSKKLCSFMLEMELQYLDVFACKELDVQSCMKLLLLMSGHV